MMLYIIAATEGVHMLLVNLVKDIYKFIINIDLTDVVITIIIIVLATVFWVALEEVTYGGSCGQQLKKAASVNEQCENLRARYTDMERCYTVAEALSIKALAVCEKETFNHERK